MSLTAKEIIEIMEKAKELGISKIKVEGIEAELDHKEEPVIPTPQEDVKAEQILSPESIFDEYTEEELLYWSTPYFDELQSRREARNQQLEKEKQTRG